MMIRYRTFICAVFLFPTVFLNSCRDLSFNPKLSDELCSGTTGTVRFIALGTEDADVSYHLTLGSTYTTLPTPVRSGFTFCGWFTEQNGSGTQYTQITVDGNPLTLYAYWQITEKITVTTPMAQEHSNLRQILCLQKQEVLSPW